MLIGMRAKASHSNMEFKIMGLSEERFNEQVFSMRVKSATGQHDGEEISEITVYDYFTKD